MPPDALDRAASAVGRFYSQDQPRDADGRWGHGGGSEILNAAPEKWSRDLINEARGLANKVGWNARDIYFALGHRLEKGDELTATNFL